MTKPADLPNDIETLKALLVASESRNLRKQDLLYMERGKLLIRDLKRLK